MLGDLFRNSTHVVIERIMSKLRLHGYYQTSQDKQQNSNYEYNKQNSKTFQKQSSQFM
jgi:hypothetical protein